MALALTLAASAIACAEDWDPPARVARLDFVEGSAALQPAGSAGWLEDVLNRPLGNGDKFMCDSGSRAEMHVGSTALRVGDETALQILNIGDRIIQVGLSSGSLSLRVRNLADGDTVEVDTPSLAVTVLAPGEYRIDVNAAGELVDVAVVSGYAQVTGQTQDFTLNARQQGEFSGSETLAVNFGDLAPADALDEWAESRDAREDNLLSANYVSPEMTGYEDLDDSGTWQELPEYGMVWQPQRQRRLGTVSSRPLGLDPAVGMDLGRRCRLGLRAVSLRALDLRQFRVVLGAGQSAPAAGLCTRAGRMDRRPTGRVGGACLSGALSTRVPRERRLPSPCQCGKPRDVAGRGGAGRESAFREPGDSGRGVDRRDRDVCGGPPAECRPAATRRAPRRCLASSCSAAGACIKRSGCAVRHAHRNDAFERSAVRARIGCAYACAQHAGDRRRVGARQSDSRTGGCAARAARD